jgi:hypothetical protein
VGCAVRLELVFPIHTLDGNHSPFYLALWRARKPDEPMSDAALRLLRERLLPRPPVPSEPLLSFVEVLP